ncbi:acyltransferase [Streptomyces actuosus]|uniref:Acyltransferase n=1 Tax=Streptomyces actuosus TaxID=1885 RepID=A0ABS2VMQ5_STRAS|nr:acyltransferase [Streptomyces actuosus]
MTDTSADTRTAPTATVARTPTPADGPARRGRAGAPRLRALDGLRLVAALMVAAYHYGGRGGEVTRAWGTSPRLQFPTLHSLFAYGSLGVQIFFVISGFVICMSGWGRPLRSFFASRAARLLPAYWAAIVLVTVVMALPFLSFATVSPTETLLNFSMLQLPLGAHRVLGVCWTLWAEVRFYVLFALCIVLPGADRRRVVMFCACWTLAVAMAGGLHQPVLDELVMPEYAPFFIGGVGLYLVHRDRTDPYAWGIVAVNWLIGQYVAVQTHWHPPQPDQFSYRSAYGIILVVTLGFLAVAAIGLGWLDWANWRWLTVAGALTYPFYLVHEHLGWVVVQGLHRGLGLPSYATFLLTVAAMLVLARLLNRFVEERFTPKLRAVLAKPRP